MQELAKTFESGGIENKWYETWSSKGYFKPKESKKGTYTLLMPLPMLR
jgi:valyl-tRNA synthetase